MIKALIAVTLCVAAVSAAPRPAQDTPSLSLIENRQSHNGTGNLHTRSISCPATPCPTGYVCASLNGGTPDYYDPNVCTYEIITGYYTYSVSDYCAYGTVCTPDGCVESGVTPSPSPSASPSPSVSASPSPVPASSNCQITNYCAPGYICASLSGGVPQCYDPTPCSYTYTSSGITHEITTYCPFGQQCTVDGCVFGTASSSPSASPSSAPSHSPAASPSSAPSHSPAASPSSAPSHSPAASPSSAPSHSPAASPSSAPSHSPAASPSSAPSHSPAASPSSAPSHSPAASPSSAPSHSPAASPSQSPAASASPSPSAAANYSNCQKTGCPSGYECAVLTGDTNPNCYNPNICMYSYKVGTTTYEVTSYCAIGTQCTSSGCK